MFSGLNPFSAAGVSQSSKIGVGLSVLSMFRSSPSAYRAVKVDKIKNDLFGKYYLATSAQNANEAKSLMKAEILTATKASATRNLGLHAYCVTDNDSSCIETINNDMSEIVIKLSDLALLQDEVVSTETVYALHVIFSPLINSSTQPERDVMLGFSPAFETLAEDGFRLRIENKSIKDKITFNDSAMISNSKWQQFIADIAHHKGVLVITPNVKTFFHNGHVYTKDELIRGL